VPPLVARIAVTALPVDPRRAGFTAAWRTPVAMAGRSWPRSGRTCRRRKALRGRPGPPARWAAPDARPVDAVPAAARCPMSSGHRRPHQTHQSNCGRRSRPPPVALPGGTSSADRRASAPRRHSLPTRTAFATMQRALGA